MHSRFTCAPAPLIPPRTAACGQSSLLLPTQPGASSPCPAPHPTPYPQVAQHGLLKKALYRDPEGVLHVKSALCTHLGCCVEWNPLEKWVCQGWRGSGERAVGQIPVLRHDSWPEAAKGAGGRLLHVGRTGQGC